MINGIRYVSQSERIQTKVYRLLHSLLKDDGVYYYTTQQLLNFDNVIEEVAWHTELNIRYFCPNEVAEALRELNFEGRAAVCDVGNGDHSILLTGRDGDWLTAFDPYWYNDERKSGEKVRIEEKPTFNTKINLDHLINDGLSGHKRGFRKGEAYPMGKNIEKRFLTVIEKPR